MVMVMVLLVIVLQVIVLQVMVLQGVGVQPNCKRLFSYLGLSVVCN